MGFLVTWTHQPWVPVKRFASVSMNSKPVQIVEYDPQWPLEFERLKGVLWNTLGELAESIEHVGSTSVPGLAAKPILDVDVVIGSRQQLPAVVEKLAGLGYVHVGDQGIAGREALDRLGRDVPRDGAGWPWMEHHLYVCARDSRELARHLFFRDYLRQNPQARDEYAALKRDLARRFRDEREAYTQAKTAFVEGVLGDRLRNLVFDKNQVSRSD
jgi:GrpB-like predicted nucleotidyltransferase (UPF0157 family)